MCVCIIMSVRWKIVVKTQRKGRVAIFLAQIDCAVFPPRGKTIGEKLYYVQDAARSSVK